MSENPRVTPNRVYIGGLPEHTRKEDLETYFGKPIFNVDLKLGFGFVEFENKEVAEETITKHHEGIFMGNKIRVEFCHRGGRRKGGHISKLERDIRHMHRSHQGEVQRRTQEIQALGEQLKKTEELSARRSAELSETQTFLSTKDRIPETEVLSIVHDLNERIYQVAVGLTEELEKLEPPPVTSRMDVDPTSEPHVSAAVRLSRNQDLTGLIYLFQSYFCSQAAKMTSSWSRYQELAMLEPIYQRLSASEGQAISARWRSLTYSHLSQSPPNPASLVEELSRILHATGLFSSTQHSLEFAQTMALEGIESTIRLAQRLELAFMVEVTSSDMFLLFEATDTIFDDTKMTNEFGSSDGSTPGKRDKIVGTTEVGVGKSISDGAGKGRRTEILLRPKVVLEKDAVKS